jgi:hypothetical protein
MDGLYKTYENTVPQRIILAWKSRIWHGFHTRDTEGNKIERGTMPPPVKLHREWQRLLAIEYTGYTPVEFDKFVDHPKKYLATGLGD